MGSDGVSHPALSTLLLALRAAKFRPGNDHRVKPTSVPAMAQPKASVPKHQLLLSRHKSPTQERRVIQDLQATQVRFLSRGAVLGFHIHTVKEMTSTLLTGTDSNVPPKICCTWTQRKRFLFAES